MQGSDALYEYAEARLENVIYSGVFEVDAGGSPPFDGSSTSAGVMLEVSSPESK